MQEGYSIAQSMNTAAQTGKSLIKIELYHRAIVGRSSCSAEARQVIDNLVEVPAFRESLFHSVCTEKISPRIFGLGHAIRYGQDARARFKLYPVSLEGH